MAAKKGNPKSTITLRLVDGDLNALEVFREMNPQFKTASACFKKGIVLATQYSQILDHVSNERDQALARIKVLEQVLEDAQAACKRFQEAITQKDLFID